jgi:hypothetical protein
LGLASLDNFDLINSLILLSVIPLSGTHCTSLTITAKTPIAKATATKTTVRTLTTIETTAKLP